MTWYAANPKQEARSRVWCSKKRVAYNRRKSVSNFSDKRDCLDKLRFVKGNNYSRRIGVSSFYLPLSLQTTNVRKGKLAFQFNNQRTAKSFQKQYFWATRWDGKLISRSEFWVSES